jgi:hypothetical protein
MPLNSGAVKGARAVHELWDAGDTVMKPDTVEAKGFGISPIENTRCPATPAK